MYNLFYQDLGSCVCLCLIKNTFLFVDFRKCQGFQQDRRCCGEARKTVRVEVGCQIEKYLANVTRIKRTLKNKES